MYVRPAFALSACLLSLSAFVAEAAFAQGGPPAETPAATEPPTAEPPLPAPVGEQPAPTTPAQAAPGAEGTPAPETTLSAEEIARLKAEVKAELAAELRQQMQAEMEAAARDVAGQRSASLEWEEERWVEEVRPQLNFLELDGYFRTRADLFNRLDLGTYDPEAQRGTSGFPVPTLYAPALDACEDPNDPDAPAICGEDTNTIVSLNMRLRLRPTLNVSEDIRIKSTIDVLDNLVLGSTPRLLRLGATLPQPVLGDQVPPTSGVNAVFDAMRVKRLWGEVMTPFGELRFGRLPVDFGLGILANAGEGLDQDFQDSLDGVFFATRIAGHYIVPGYSIAASGPVGRGGGAGLGNNIIGIDGEPTIVPFFPNEPGQRYNLDPRDDVHTFLLSVVRRDKEEDIEARLRAGDWVLNYGAFGLFQTQQYDIPGYSSTTGPLVGANPDVTADDYVLRNANTGTLSLWARFQWDKLRVEAEAVGVLGRIDNTSRVADGLEAQDPALLGNPLWIVQGGAALESAYAFLNDSLVVGLDGGIASGDAAPGFGLRPVAQEPGRLGDLDGRQYGACTARNEAGECTEVDNFVTNYRFDPAYNIDLILFREILGTVTDAVYVKPHVAYYVTETFGVRGDLIYSNALNAASTPGLTSPLGVEGDGTVFYTSDDGFVVMLQGGVFFPLGGFNHPTTVLPTGQVVSRPVGGVTVADGSEPGEANYVQAQFAYTLQAFVGIVF